jgi:hypothetical protein
MKHVSTYALLLRSSEKLYLQNTDLSGAMPKEICALRDGNDTKIEAIEVPCDVECNMETCCTMCGR